MGSKYCNALFPALITAAATNPKLLEPLRERFRVWQQAIERDGIGSTRATVVRLAVDGLWLADVLGIWTPSDTLRTQVLQELLRLTRDVAQDEVPPMTKKRARASTPHRSRRADNV